MERYWAGRGNPASAAPDWGDYRISAYDLRNSELLYRAGFDSSLHPDASAAATNLSVRLPFPAGSLRAVVEKRRAGSVFMSLWESVLDITSPSIDRSAPPIEARIDRVLDGGPPDSMVDLAITGDGYVADEYPKFLADAKRAAAYLFSVEPFATRMKAFNAYGFHSERTEWRN
jgi:hypothetical protein